jgi:hypothetical protein
VFLTLLLALAAMLLSGACEVRSQVGVQVDEDGSGSVTVTVRLDAEATRRLGDPTSVVRSEDLVAAGWAVEEPERPDGGAVLRARRSFASPSDLPSVLDEVGGTDGVFRQVELRVEDGFASTEYSFAAQVELSGNPEQFGDDALTATLGGLALARTPEELALEGAADPAAMTLEVAVDLPGGDPETNGEVRDGVATWSFPVSGGEPTSAALTATSTTGTATTRVLAVAGVVAVVLAGVLLVVGLVRRRG